MANSFNSPYSAVIDAKVTGLAACSNALCIRSCIGKNQLLKSKVKVDGSGDADCQFFIVNE
ncbi:MAG: hypothetical protein ACI936_002036 [Paraglaciecola sp.]|jgi:hypothetical protein